MTDYIIDGIDYECYKDTHDIPLMVLDRQSGTDTCHESVDYYAHATIVTRSLLNGQFIQARQQCAEYGLNYTDELTNFKNQIGE